MRFSEQANIPDPNGAFTGGFITLIIMHNFSISTFSSLLYACNTSCRQVPQLRSICLALDEKKKKVYRDVMSYPWVIMRKAHCDFNRVA